MAEKSYAYAVGNVRARENRLLKRSDIEQLLSYDNAAACAAFLRDKGYGESDTPQSTDALLLAEEKKLWNYIKEVSPDFSVFTAFIVVNDYHNLKAALKGTAASKSYDQLFLYPVSVDTAVIKNAVSQQSFALLPEHMQECAASAWERLVASGDSQGCDAVIDAACLKKRLEEAEKIKNPMLEELVKSAVFFDNIKAAIRCADAKKNGEFAEMCLVETDAIMKSDLVSAVIKGRDAVLELLEGASKYGGAQAAEAFKTSPSQFEKFVDNYMMRVALRGKYIAVGAEPLIAYLQARLAELKTVRIAVNAVATGEDRDRVREMLRELYG